MICALLLPAVIGCSDSIPAPPNVTPTQPTNVHVNSQTTPLLVAYRDGFDTSGQPLAWTMATGDLKMVTFSAHDAYSVAVVCQVDANTVLTWQAFHTVDDDTSDTVKEPTLQTPCNAAPPARNQVTGTLVQAGFAHLDDADFQSSSPAASITLEVPDGTFDLVASTDLADASMNKTLIRRNVMISSSNSSSLLLGVVDASTGSAQVALSLSLNNPPDPKKSTETVEATVDVTTKNNAGPGRVSHAQYDLKNQEINIFALPNAALTSDDTQNATFIGSDHPKPTVMTTRSITKPFSVGDDTATGMSGFTLPAKISIPSWGFDQNRLSVALPALPALDDLTIETAGTSSTDATKNAKYMINITKNYFTDTTLARPVFDTNITGFQPAWKIDFTKQYSRQITSERDVFDMGVFVDHETSQFAEDVNAPAP